MEPVEFSASTKSSMNWARRCSLRGCSSSDSDAPRPRASLISVIRATFSPASEAALSCAKELAEQFDARLSLLHVITNPAAQGVWMPEVYVPASVETQETFLREARVRLTALITDEERARFRVKFEARVGAAAEVIQDFTREQDVSLIVMGTHGRTGLMHMLLGSVAERTVRTAPCPVLTTHADSDPASEARMAEIAEAGV
jgi:universal stress protein A